MIGVLALQGAFLEHIAAFAALGVAAKEVRRGTGPRMSARVVPSQRRARR